MILAMDIGNTRTKAFLIDKHLKIIDKKIWSTPDLFEPDRWKVFFNELDKINPLFTIVEKRISCVSWKAFLALRVYLGYDIIENFDPNKEFNSDLLILPLDSPFVFENRVPLDTTYTTGLIGSDRLLAAYVAYTLYNNSCMIVSLGTATTLDIVTNTGAFLGGAILPGIDVSYYGLKSRVSHLPELSELPIINNTIGKSTLESLSIGIYISHAMMIESLYIRQIKEADLQSEVSLILTGGRAFTIGNHIRLPFNIKEDLVIYGLALIPSWQKTADQINIKDLQENPSHFDYQSQNNEGMKEFNELNNLIKSKNSNT